MHAVPGHATVTVGGRLKDAEVWNSWESWFQFSAGWYQVFDRSLEYEDGGTVFHTMGGTVSLVETCCACMSKGHATKFHLITCVQCIKHGYITLSLIKTVPALKQPTFLKHETEDNTITPKYITTTWDINSKQKPKQMISCEKKMSIFATIVSHTPITTKCHDRVRQKNISSQQQTHVWILIQITLC